MAYRDISGQRFGRLTTLSPVDKKDSKYRGKRWLCSCDCFRTVEVLGKYLVQGRVKSCGCLYGKYRVEWKGKEYTHKELSEKFGIPKSTLQMRIKRGWPIERALHEPVKK